jgi:hypothetical protein
MAEKTVKPRLMPALIQAQRSIGGVEKGTRNDFHGYDYASAEDVIKAGRGALLDNGLALVRTGWLLSTLPALTLEQYKATPSSGAFANYMVTASWLLVHESGEERDLGVTDCVVTPGKGQAVDKAQAAALTTCENYLLVGLLQIPRVNQGDDISGREDRPQTQEPPAEKATPPKADKKPLRSDEEMLELKKFYEGHGWTASEIMATCQQAYDRTPRELTKDQLREVCRKVKDDPHGQDAPDG